MNKNLLTLIVMCWAFMANGQCTFERFYPYYETNYLYHKMIKLSDGGYLNYGNGVKDTVGFGFKEADLVLIKTDSCGKLIWINDKGYLADEDPDKYAIETRNGVIIVTGYSAASSSIWLGKYSKNGELIKEKKISGSKIASTNGIVQKNNLTETFLISGNTSVSLSSAVNPFLFEIDENLNIVRNKVFSFTEINDTNHPLADLGAVQLVDDITIVCLISTENSTDMTVNLHLLHLDTTFKIKKQYRITNDTIYSISFYSLFLSRDKSHLIGFASMKRTKNSRVSNCALRIRLDGTIFTQVNFTDQFVPTSMSPTHDGGYIIGSSLLKIDSNFSIEWKRETGGILGNVEQLSDGGYIGGGLSIERTKYWGDGYFEMYLVRTDKDGNYLRSGGSEISYNSILTIFPNPANTTLSVQSSFLYSMLELRNLTGSVVMTTTNTQTMDVSGVPQGLYILRLFGAQHESLATQKVSVEH